jgi:hypothetical protein
MPHLSYVCPIPWTTMPGDERSRFCSQCARTVVNVSFLTESQRAALLENPPPGGLCVAYYRRLSGEMVSAERPLTPAEASALTPYGIAALSFGVAALAGVYAPEVRTAVEDVRIAAAQSYTLASAEAVARGREAIEKIGVNLGLKKPEPVVMVLGMIACPPSAPAATTSVPLPAPSP